MGSAKDELEKAEGLRQHAIDILLRTGNLETCEDHEDALFAGENDDGDLTPAYKIANAEYTAEQTDGTAHGRRDITDAIKAAYEDNSGIDQCPYCNKNSRD